MEQLRELEKRVLDVIQKNKNLQEELSKLKAENRELQGQCKQYEASLMNQNETSQSMVKEKASIKTTIEELLKTINSLEAGKGATSGE
ncbi:hypothetical protein KKA53_04765 [Candidatus Dependentiae bacterium]|nr:hypothetical protein [Candidatus Dependentiae bacterium]